MRVAIMALALIIVTGAANAQPLGLGKVTADGTQVPRCGKIEFKLDIQGTYANPFDPDEIAVDGTFKGPDGKTVTVPGFYFQDYTHELKDGREVMTPQGRPEWRIRFSPTQVGHYDLTVTARDKADKVTSKPVGFECAKSNSPGFVRISTSDKRYFAFDSGESYVPIGANVCWAGGRGLYDYEDWLPRYEQSGCNYFRLWLGPGWVTFALERKSVRKFDLANAWRLDQVMEMAAKRGMYVMLCLDSFNELRKTAEGGYPYWDETPHNAKNGGPLAEPREFWTNTTMQRLYRNKLRYMVARYGWDTHVMSWEFWNEVDIISPTAYIPDEVAKWHADMSEYLRSIDPWKHLQTTSFASSDGKPEIDRLPRMDYVQTHNYGSRDLAEALPPYQRKKEVYGKPHYVGEFGTDAALKEGTEQEAIALHNGIWSSLLSGGAGSAMLWWWDNRIHPGNLYHHFAALSGFVKDVDFPKEGFERIESDLPNLRLIGLRGKHTSLIWIQNPQNTWHRVCTLRQPPKSQAAIVLRIAGWPAGRYRARLWDTYAGKETDTQELTVGASGLALELPSIEKDIALRIEKL